MAIEVGTVITVGQHEYQVQSKVNEGGFGVVFRAKQTKPPPILPFLALPDIAIKIPAAHVLADSVLRAKFAREARILANVTHRNVVKIIAFWQFEDGDVALAQELVPNAKTLSEYIAEHPDEAPSVYLQVLYALRAIHDNGLGQAAVHRDLSPRNILVDEHGRVKVIDFGLAKEDPRVTQVLTVAGQWFGTPGCMAPEQVSAAADVDERADLFSLGRSMTAALQGRNPLHAHPERLPEPWKTLCSHLCEHDADDRPSTADLAIGLAMDRFASEGVKLTDMKIHVEEMRGRVPPAAWNRLCDGYFNGLQDIDQKSVSLASRLSGLSFAPPFDANRFFDLLSASSALAAFNASWIDFDDLDPVGDVLEELYPYLDGSRKPGCFTRLVRLAVRGHRFQLMGQVRAVYGAEPDQNVKASLLSILNAEDPHGVILGAGIIPGR